ncbi:MAG TPA: hypothetical protein VFJ58_05755 [Armatimonadota bacterium]|nr:hypothetical protein [Armatimonadota bacterium]
MTWIKTVPSSEASHALKNALEDQGKLYPPEYRIPVESAEQHGDEGEGASIVSSHSLLPQTLYHSFATYGTLLSSDLPLTRRQHEMIAATVSSLNRCFY